MNLAALGRIDELVYQPPTTWFGVSLVLVQVAYLVYIALGITESRWASGIYFSANDVLHVGMLAWLAITAWALGPSLEDRAA